jgi:hypothetical protein
MKDEGNKGRASMSMLVRLLGGALLQSAFFHGNSLVTTNICMWRVVSNVRISQLLEKVCI